MARQSVSIHPARRVAADFRPAIGPDPDPDPDPDPGGRAGGAEGPS
jgi:hypothetical protein